MLSVGRAVRPDVQAHIQHGTLHHMHQLSLLVRGELKVESTQDILR